ncbi:MAG: PilC/PilY family type IV pilus protein [Pseudomonadota bacterium]|nr:PilC/PilY family type IV pilus protein [Pseudomonadota bacterium]
MTTRTGSTLLALTLCASLTGTPIMAAADDIDIFTGASAGNAVKPRILIVLDNTSNWARQSQQWPGGLQQGQAEARAISALLPTLDNGVQLGLMEFVTGGNANDDGGFIRSALREMNTDNQAAFAAKLATIRDNINSPDEKRNSRTPYGDLMYDVYNYFAGAESFSPSATLASVADTAGYTSAFTRFKSPLTADSTCGKSFVIFIGNPNSSGPSADSAANTTALNLLTNARDARGNLIPVTQLGLPNFTTRNVAATSNVGTTDACYADTTAAQAGLGAFSTACGLFTEGCAIGAPTAPLQPVACPAGSLSYSVVQSVFHPATSTPGAPVVGTATTSSANSTGYYGSAASVPSTDHGSLTCPATTSGTSGSNTYSTTYSCSYSVGAAVGSATPVTSSASSNQAGNAGGAGCYTGVGTATGNWNPATTTDFGGLSCPVNSSCTYAGVTAGTASGCTGSGKRHVTVTQTATPKRQYTVTQTVTPTTVNSAVTAAYTSTSVLGKTSQCYASGPSSTSDFAASCTGTNISCTYNNTPTSSTLAACPAGTNAYKVDGTNIELTDVPTGTSSTDTAPRNADEWARLLHDQGVPVAGSSISPSVSTYTIDVYNKQPNATQTALLMSMAKAGGGKYFAAKSEQAIIDALKQIIVEILAVNTSFASTSLPVNATNRSQNENQVFIGMFRPDPDAKPRWFGNLKRYQLITAGANIELGDIAGKPAVNTLTGFVTPCAQSYWTSDSGAYWGGMGLNPDPAGSCTLGVIANPALAGTTIAVGKYSDAPDGPQVEKGAAAQILRQGNVGGTSTTSHAVNRTMFTYAGGTFTPFTAASSGLDADLVKFVRGEDVNDEKGTGEISATRPSIHGDVIHSRPLPVNYGGSTGVTVYYGANDGTLHAVNAANGVERWAFVAPEFFSRLARIKNNSPLVSYPNLAAAITPPPTPKDYFYDGSTGIYQNGDSSKVWIYPTMRRGGRMIYGIDASDPAAPRFLWRAGCPNLGNDTDCTAGMSGIGQTWSTPNVSFLKGYPDHPVVIVGGGYDGCEDANSATPACGAGKGGMIYVLDAETGAVLRSFATDRAVAADVALVDIDNDGKPDYAYAADTGGNLYRISFLTSTGLAGASADWSVRKVAYTSGAGRKFLFAPALLAAQGKVYVALGSGDREHPLASQYPFAGVVNRFYVYKDDLSAPALALPKDMDTMENYTANSSCTTPAVLPASSLSGWFMDLNQYGQGEQAVTSALIASGMVTFSTNRPIAPAIGTCASSLGQARGYWVNLFNGAGAINVAGACGGARASVFVGGGLPPSPVMASAVPVDGKAVSVVIGAVQKGGAAAAGVSVAISPQRIRPTNQPKRKRAYTYVSGD